MGFVTKCCGVAPGAEHAQDCISRPSLTGTLERAQTDAEIGALFRAAYALHMGAADCPVELDRIESVEVSAVIGPGKVEMIAMVVRHTSKLKGGK